MAKKTAKQLDTEVANALASSGRRLTYHLTTRSVYSRSAQMPTVSNYIATLSPLDGRDIQFKRETRGQAIRAALAYADKRHLEVERRALVEAKLAAVLAAESKGP